MLPEKSYGIVLARALKIMPTMLVVLSMRQEGISIVSLPFGCVGVSMAI